MVRFVNRRFRALLLSSVAMSFLLVASGVSAQAVPTADTSYEFGEVKQGEIVTHVFNVTNKLNDPVKISRIDLSARGMTVRAKPLINPNETGVIEISWNTTMVVHGVSGVATVHFTDSKMPDLKLMLNGVVLPPIDALPIAGFYISLFTDESPERSIAIVNHQDHALGIRKLVSESSLFSAELTPRTQGQSYDVTVKVPAGLKPGRYSDTIRLETDDQKYPTIQLPVNLLVKGNLYAIPDAIDFGQVDLARISSNADLLALLSQRVMVEKRSGTFAIKSIDSDVAGLRIAHSPEAANQKFELTITLDPKSLKAGPLTGVVRIQTSDAETPTITIAVRGQVQ